GVMSFTLGYGQSLVISTMTVNSLNDVHLLGLAAGREEPGAESIKLAAGLAAGTGGYATSSGHPLALIGPLYASRNYLAVGLAGSHPGDFLVKGYSGFKSGFNCSPWKGYPD